MNVLIVFLSLVVSVLLGWVVVEVILRLAKVRGVERRAMLSFGGHSARVLREQQVEPHVLWGGSWIGALERIAVTGSIMAAQPELIAVVVAIKGLGRWADLQTNPALTERFIIGTLSSYVVAAACGYAGLAFL